MSEHDYAQSSASISNSSSRGAGEGFRWRPWPCPSCRRSYSARGYLGGGVSSGAELLEIEREERTTAEVADLIEWAASCPHSTPQEIALPQYAEGSEHRVFLDLTAGQVYKHTLTGTFGDTYYLVNNRVHQRRCLPSDYLARLELWDRVFGNAPLDLGISNGGHIVTVQKHIRGSIPTQDEVDDYLAACGLEDVKKQCFIWKWRYDSEEVGVGDTRDENFVKTPSGIVPIDVRLWFT